MNASGMWLQGSYVVVIPR